MTIGILTMESEWLTACFVEAERRTVRAETLPADVSLALERLLRRPPDVLLLDASETAWELLLGIERLPLMHLPQICLRHGSVTDRLMLRFSELIRITVPTGYPVTDVFERLVMIAQDERRCNPSVGAVLDRMTTELLLYGGVPPHLKGFRLLRSAILMLLSEPKGTKLSVMHQIYPTLAKQSGATVSMVEHAMRHAIDSGWMRADLDAIEALFGYTVQENKATPSNAAFIHTVADRVRIRYENERAAAGRTQAA